MKSFKGDQNKVTAIGIFAEFAARSDFLSELIETHIVLTSTCQLTTTFLILKFAISFTLLLSNIPYEAYD